MLPCKVRSHRCCRSLRLSEAVVAMGRRKAQVFVVRHRCEANNRRVSRTIFQIECPESFIRVLSKDLILGNFITPRGRLKIGA